MLGVGCGAALIWLNLMDVLSFVGLALMGFASAPIFPSLISSTPKRLGPEHAPNVIGFQVGAASLGIALLPATAGVLAERFGLEVIGPFLLLASTAMLLLHEATVSRTR
jgi:fucose permease